MKTLSPVQGSFQKAMFPLAANVCSTPWKDAVILVLLILPWISVPDAAFAQVSGTSSLTVVIHGIRDEASSSWVGDAAVVGSTRERYVISYDDGTKKAERKFGRYLKSLTPLFDEDHLIRVNPDDPKSQSNLRQRLDEIAKKPNATVIVDMDLGASSVAERIPPASLVFKSQWAKQTRWAGNVAADLAEQHLAKHPDSKTTLVAHSAGNDAGLWAFQRELVTGKTLFNQRSILMSPRSPDEIPKNALVILADGDFIASPGGTPSFASTRTAEDLKARGILVARIASENGSRARNWPDLSSLSVRWVGSAMQAHKAVTEMWTPAQKVLIYAPGVEKPVEMPSTSLGNVVKTVLAAEVSAGNSHASNFDGAKLNQAVSNLRASEPTPGIGGISLNTVAQLPMTGEQVSKAGYEARTNLLFLLLRNGKRIFLPQMDKEVLRLAYEVAYRDDKKPELSIGAAPEGAGGNVQHGPNRVPVYYLGKTDGTMLGLVMYLADEALGTLAFCSTKIVSPVSDEVAGFHSLPELYAQRYAYQPKQSSYPGANSVFLHSALVELIWSAQADTLEFGNVRFNLRFDRAGPAEDTFAAFFVAHFDEIARTKVGEPFQSLLPYAEAVALFRWMKENHVNLSSSEFESVPFAPVFTPHEVAVRPLPKLDEIAPRAPTIFFGPFGPERIVRPDGRETTVTYNGGLPTKVHRYDGSVLEVRRDSIGNPIGLQIGEKNQAGFYVDPAVGFVFAEDVQFVLSAGTFGIKLSDKSTVYPDNQPEATTRVILSRFAFEESHP